MSDPAWFLVRRPVAAPRLRLHAFPYAGGGTSRFDGWEDGLPPDVELAAARLPGRESRLRERPVSDVRVLARQLADAVGTDVPYALFGYSVGGLVAFEVARELRRRGAPLPAHLVVAACPAPSRPPRMPPTAGLTDAAFRTHVIELGGTPAELVASDELMDLLLPALRADFELPETYAYAAEPPLGCPLTLVVGTADPHTDDADDAAWAAETSSAAVCHRVPGDHFFVHERTDELVALVAEALAPDVRPGLSRCRDAR